MGEPDLLGFDDCGPDFAEEDSDTLEHVQHRAYWAINTGRGQDWEQPDRWLAIEAFIESTATAILQAHAQSVGTDLAEVDPQIESAEYRVAPGEVTTWTAEIKTARGTTFAKGTLQPLPQDTATSEDDGGPAYQDPVPAGGKTIRQGALLGDKTAWFPHWLTGPNSGRIVYTIGLLLDMSTEWLMQGIQQRFPLLCDEGALPYLGRDLGILRGVRESVDAYRKRLTLWAPTHRRAGTPFAIAEQIQAYFAPQSPTVYVVQHDPGADGKPTRATWSIRYPDGVETTIVEQPSNWDVDSDDPARPASLDTRDPRLWVIVEQPAGGVGGIQGLFAARTSVQAAVRDPDGMNGATRPGGARAPADQYRDLAGIAQQWRAMGTWIAGVLVYFGAYSPTATDATHPDGRWHDPLNDAKNGNRVHNSLRLLYMNRYPGNYQASGDAPYTV
jgi:hypothetical protein